jgi:thiol-disulfide isomerase/thioredoxin
MRKQLIPLAAASLCWLAGISVFAQDPAQNSQTPPKNSGQPASGSQSQPSTNADDPAQPVSLADAARLARAKKQSTAPKAIRVLDDDNMPRGVYPIETKPAPKSEQGGSAVGSASRGASLSEFRGKVVLLDFWASWCGPCRRALPSLKRLQAVYGSDDLVVVSISEDDDQAAWQAFTSANQMTWPQRLDSDGNFQRQFIVTGLPTYVLIGRDGNVVDKLIGEDPATSIMERIGPELKEALAAKT